MLHKNNSLLLKSFVKNYSNKMVSIKDIRNRLATLYKEVCSLIQIIESLDSTNNSTNMDIESLKLFRNEIRINYFAMGGDEHKLTIGEGEDSTIIVGEIMDCILKIRKLSKNVRSRVNSSQEVKDNIASLLSAVDVFMAANPSFDDIVSGGSDSGQASN